MKTYRDPEAGPGWGLSPMCMLKRLLCGVSGFLILNRISTFTSFGIESHSECFSTMWVALWIERGWGKELLASMCSQVQGDTWTSYQSADIHIRLSPERVISWSQRSHEVFIYCAFVGWRLIQRGQLKALPQFPFIGLFSGVSFHVLREPDHLKALSHFSFYIHSITSLNSRYLHGTHLQTEDVIHKGYFSTDMAVMKLIPGWNFSFITKSLRCPYYLPAQWRRGQNHHGLSKCSMFLCLSAQ